jgi:Co/Zn/Cd efflux system component
MTVNLSKLFCIVFLVCEAFALICAGALDLVTSITWIDPMIGGLVAFAIAQLV